MRRFWFVLLLAPFASGEPIANPSIDVTATSQTITFGAPTRQSLCIRGGLSGDDEIYYRIFTDCETSAAAVADAANTIKLVAQESDCYDFSAGEGGSASTGCIASGYAAISLICAGGETATASYRAKEGTSGGPR